jgi:hypothetical protein
MFDSLLSAPGWFPQQYAVEFFVSKGLLAMVAVLLYLHHMMNVWTRIPDAPQRMRYLSLFYFACYVTFASVEQAQSEDEVTWQHFGAYLGAILLIATSVVSIRHDRTLRLPPVPPAS